MLGVTSSSSKCAPRKWLSKTTSSRDAPVFARAEGPSDAETGLEPERNPDPPNSAAERTRA